jgi:hypothetical protein
VGGAIVLVALVSVIADASTGRSPGRMLTVERASQNVVSLAPATDQRVRLIVTAPYDAGRSGLIYLRAPRRAAARLRQAAGRAALGWQGWIVLCMALLVLVAVRRNSGDQHSVGIVILQLVPTLILVLAVALLVELGVSDPAPGAGDSGSAAALAVALVQALDAAPPRHVAVELVLQGAGDGPGIGLRQHVRRRKLKIPDVVVLGIAPCGRGEPRWWVSDGALLPLRYLPRLNALCRQVAADEEHLRARPHRGRGTGPALPARARGLPAITIGCLDGDGLVPDSHTPQDIAANLKPSALDAALAYTLLVVDAIDEEVGRRAPEREAGKQREQARRRPRGAGSGIIGRRRARRRGERQPPARTPRG